MTDYRGKESPMKRSVTPRRAKNTQINYNLMATEGMTSETTA